MTFRSFFEENNIKFPTWEDLIKNSKSYLEYKELLKAHIASFGNQFDIGIDKGEEGQDYAYRYEVDKYEMAKIRNAIRLLGLPDEFREDDLHKAYRKRAKEAHPDHGGSHEKFLEVKEAHEFLNKYFNI